MKTEIRVRMNEYGDRPEVEVNERERVDAEAHLALVFIEKWGMVAGEPDGEDSAGRQKGRLATPEEVVERAFTIAALAMATARAKGLTVLMPSFAEIDEIKAQHKAEKAAKKATA